MYLILVGYEATATEATVNLTEPQETTYMLDGSEVTAYITSTKTYTYTVSEVRKSYATIDEEAIAQDIKDTNDNQ